MIRSLLVAVLALALGLLSPGGPAALAATGEAVLAGGCFWCLEHDLEALPGVLDVESGYSGGSLSDPTYRQVSRGGTGHQESVRVRYDTTAISYQELLRAYWRNIDPFDGGGQFCDRGGSYRPVIFTAEEGQSEAAEASLSSAAGELGQPPATIQVDIRPLSRFWPAEIEHQNYADLHPVQYGYYRWSCGRDRRLEQVWGSSAREGSAWRGEMGPD